MQAEALKPFIDEELLMSTTPIFYRTKSGGRGVGYDAELLPRVCEVYLKFRDWLLTEERRIPTQYAKIFRACDALIRGLARVGIVALIDEATGYQEVRDRLALQAILDRFLRKEFAIWARRFPPSFYKEMFRLRGWEWSELSTKRPPRVAADTNDLVYERLAPGLIKKLQELNPKDERGNRRYKHHQGLTDDIGLPALAQHLHAVEGFMRAASDWEEFYRLMQRAFPKQNTTMLLPMSDAKK